MQLRPWNLSCLPCLTYTTMGVSLTGLVCCRVMVRDAHQDWLESDWLHCWTTLKVMAKTWFKANHVSLSVTIKSNLLCMSVIEGSFLMVPSHRPTRTRKWASHSSPHSPDYPSRKCPTQIYLPCTNGRTRARVAYQLSIVASLSS